MTDLLQAKSLELKTGSGATKTFYISKWPAVAGRELVAKYPVANLPKLGDYGVSEETMFKNLSFVAVELEGGATVRLSTRALIDQHCEDWETLARLEWAMVEYNCSFFGNGGASISFDGLIAKLRPLISQMLTASSAPSSPAGTPASET